MPIRLGLRHNRHMVSVIKPDGWRHEALGRAYADGANPRLRILEQWGIAARSPRLQETLVAPEVPLDRRAQAILSYQVDAGLRARLTDRFGTLASSRRDVSPGLRARVQLGAGGAVLSVDALFSGRGRT